MIGPMPANATLRAAKPENLVGRATCGCPGRLPSPVVAGAAALVLAKHPNWTPDMVKGALMAKARYVPEEGLTGAAGVGEVNAFRSAMMSNAPNPNLALNRFVGTDPVTGATVFNAVSWTDAARPGELERRVLDGRQLERRLLVGGLLVGRLLERRLLERRLLERRAGTADVTWEDAADYEVAPPEGIPLALTPEEEAAALADPDLGLAPEPAAATPVTRQNKGRATIARPLPHSDGGCRPFARPTLRPGASFPLRLRTD